jgi:hypothetical protein
LCLYFTYLFHSFYCIVSPFRILVSFIFVFEVYFLVFTLFSKFIHFFLSFLNFCVPCSIPFYVPHSIFRLCWESHKDGKQRFLKKSRHKMPKI